MQFRDKEYFDASLDRLRQAQVLTQQEGSYALAIYCGGLAVECMLRAFRWREDATFDGRHDLIDLLKASKILGTNEDFMRAKGNPEDVIHNCSIQFRAAMNTIVVIWHNSLRYASEKRLKTHLANIGMVQGIRGDALKKNAVDLIEAASFIVDRGNVLWR